MCAATRALIRASSTVKPHSHALAGNAAATPQARPPIRFLDLPGADRAADSLAKSAVIGVIVRIRAGPAGRPAVREAPLAGPERAVQSCAIAAKKCRSSLGVHTIAFTDVGNTGRCSPPPRN